MVRRLASLALLPLLAWLLVVALHLTVGLGEPGLADPAWKVAYNGLIFAAAAVCLLGAPAGERRAWALIAGALACWAVGNTYWTFFLVDLDSPPYPSVSDVFWLAFYPPVYLALVLLLRSRVRARDQRPGSPLAGRCAEQTHGRRREDQPVVGDLPGRVGEAGLAQAHRQVEGDHDEPREQGQQRETREADHGLSIGSPVRGL